MTPSEPVRKYKYRLLFVPSAWKEWQDLDGSVKEPLRKLLRKRLDNPHVPGGALHGDLGGHYKIKLLKQGFRLVYGVEDDALIVMVMAVTSAMTASFTARRWHVLPKKWPPWVPQ